MADSQLDDIAQTVGGEPQPTSDGALREGEHHGERNPRALVLVGDVDRAAVKRGQQI